MVIAYVRFINLNLKLTVCERMFTAKNRFAATLTDIQGGPLVELKPNLTCHFYSAVLDTLHLTHDTGAFLPDENSRRLEVNCKNLGNYVLGYTITVKLFPM